MVELGVHNIAALLARPVFDGSRFEDSLFFDEAPPQIQISMTFGSRVI